MNARDALHAQSALEMATFHRLGDVVRLMLDRGVRADHVRGALKLAARYNYGELVNDLQRHT